MLEIMEASVYDAVGRQVEGPEIWEDDGRPRPQPPTEQSPTEWIGWGKGSWRDEARELEVLGEQAMLVRLDSWEALAKIGYVLLVSSDCSHDPFDPSGRCSYSWQVWGMFPEGVLNSEKPEEWERYLEFPCKTKCIGGGGVLWSSDCEVHSFGGETPGVTAAMAGLVPVALRNVTVVQVVDNMGVKDVHPTAAARPMTAWLNRTNGDSWRETAHLQRTVWPPSRYRVIHTHSHTDDHCLVPRRVLKFANRMSDRSAEEIRMNVGEPIQQEPLFASRPRWALEVGDKKVTGAVAKHMTAAVNMVHATDYMTSRGDHASPIRIGSAQRNYGTDTEWNAMRYSTNKWNASMRPKIFITKMLSDWLPIHDTRPGRGNRGRDFSDVVLKEGLQLGVCDHCSDRWSLGHLWSDCQHKEVVGIRQQGRAEREAAVVDAGWLGMEARSVLRWWFRSELLLNGT